MAKLFVTVTIVCLMGAALVEGIDFEASVQKCQKELGATDADATQLRQLNPISSETGKCLAGCVMQSQGVMDSNGKYVQSAGLSKVEQLLARDEANKKRAIDAINACFDIEVPSNPCEAGEAYSKCFKANF